MDDPRDDKLAELDERIEEARRLAQEHGSLPDPDEQTLADPDGDGDVDEVEAQPPG